MKKTLFVLAVALLLVSCASSRARQTLRSGMLTVDLNEAVFLEIWGLPDKTATMSSDEITRANWGGMNGGFFKGKEVLEVWTYDRKKADLVFNKRKFLMAWHTDSTVKELAEPQ